MKKVKKRKTSIKRSFDNTQNNFNKKQNFKEFKNNYEDDNFQLEGRNSILEALNHNRDIDKILVKKGEVEGTLKVIVAKALEKGIVVQEVDKLKLDQMKKTNNHQGVIAICPAHKYSDVQDILQNAKDKGEDPFIIILDEITDPHNLGAIIRTAETVNAHGVIIPKRRSASLTPIVSKTSAGAIEYVPVARVNNITKEIEKLKKAGLWIACTDVKGTNYFDADLKGPIGIVIGNEGEGVSRLTKETCDFSVKIPMLGKIQSLNASVAAGIVMTEVARQRNFL